jgi:fructokinase
MSVVQNKGETTLVFGESLVDDFATEQIVGGAPFNVARHLAAFMAPQLMITRIGADHNGETIRAEFERFAMSLAQRGERSRGTLKALLSATSATRYLDLNLRDGQVDEKIVADSLHAADIAKLNEDELQSLFGWYFQLGPNDPPMAADETRSACAALLQMFGLEALIVTLGHRGSVYFGAGGVTVDTRDAPSPPFVIDTVGAGDAFSAIFLLGRARGWPLELTLARANEFAGAICAIPGAVPRDLGFYDQWMTRWR